MDNNNQPITLDDLAGMMKDGFDDLSGRMNAMEERLGGRMDSVEGKINSMEGHMNSMEGRIESIEKTMATKDDLGKLRSDMIDYIAKQNLELKTDLILIMRGEDRKLFSLIELMIEKHLITKDDANRVTKLEPFPQGV